MASAFRTGNPALAWGLGKVSWFQDALQPQPRAWLRERIPRSGTSHSLNLSLSLSLSLGLGLGKSLPVRMGEINGPNPRLSSRMELRCLRTSPSLAGAEARIQQPVAMGLART